MDQSLSHHLRLHLLRLMYSSLPTPFTVDGHKVPPRNYMTGFCIEQLGLLLFFEGTDAETSVFVFLMAYIFAIDHCSESDLKFPNKYCYLV